MNLEMVVWTHRPKLACLHSVVGLRPGYAKSIVIILVLDATSCATFLVTTTGPWIAILGVVITDGMIVQRLTDYIRAGLDCVFNESHIIRVARTFYALNLSLKKLDSYYKNLDLTCELPAGSRYFPLITTYRCSNGGGNIKFEYIGFLENCPDSITLRARTETMEDIVVKFVDRYGVRTHKILADEGLAPKLLYYGSPRLDDDDDGPSYESISMVVMEYIDGNTFAVAKPKMSQERIETVRLALQDALDLLHRSGLVFGDLRPPNFMTTNNCNIKLIDFDWAGEAGCAKYPLFMSPDIPWPEGVKQLAIMEKMHDLDMLKRFF